MRNEAALRHEIQLHDEIKELRRQIRERDAEIVRLRTEVADRDNAEMQGLRTAYVAMTLANALPGISDEYDFGPAITEVRTLLHTETRQ